MAKKVSFDQDATFKSIIGATESPQVVRETGKKESGSEGTRRGRPKSEGETKKRVSLALYPSSYEALQKIAREKQQSVSSIVSELIVDYVRENER